MFKVNKLLDVPDVFGKLDPGAEAISVDRHGIATEKVGKDEDTHNHYRQVRLVITMTLLK